MLFKNKSINIIVSFVFLFNVVFNNVSAAQTGFIPSNHLSPVLKCNDLIGIEHKDIFRIQFALEPHLAGINRKSGKNTAIDLESFKKELGYKTGKENTVFYPSEVQFFYNEAKELINGDICVMCRVVDPDKGEDISRAERTRTYYVVVSARSGDDEAEFYCREIYTEKEYKQVRGELSFFAPRDTKDKDIINRYASQNEEVIDSFIRKRIKSGDFAEIESIRSSLDWKKKFSGAISPKEENMWARGLYDAIGHQHLADFLAMFGLTPQDILSGRNLVFIRVPEKEDFPSVSVKIDKNGREIGPDKYGEIVEVKVQSHASNNAVYVFINAQDFDALSSASKMSGEKGNMVFFDEKIILDRIIPCIVHETGAIHGLEAYHRDGKTMNQLSSAWEDFVLGGYSVNHFEKSLLEKYPGLSGFSVGTEDLDKILSTRDYMMAKKKKTPSKGGKKKKLKKPVKKNLSKKVKKRTEEAKNEEEIQRDIINKEAALYNAYLRIFNISPVSSEKRDKGAKAVMSFLNKVKALTNQDVYMSLKWVMGDTVFRDKVSGGVFNEFLTSEKFSNFMLNIWNMYERRFEITKSGFTEDEISQSLLFLVSDMYKKMIYINSVEDRDITDKVKADVMYIAMFALVNDGRNLSMVVDRFMKEKHMVWKMRTKLSEKSTGKLKKRLMRTAGTRGREVLDRLNVKDFSPENFMALFREKAAEMGMETKKIDAILINAAEKDAGRLLLKLAMPPDMPSKVKVYLLDLELSKQGITSSPALISHLKSKFPELSGEKGILDEVLLRLASSDMGDMVYIDDLIEVRKLSRDELRARMRTIKSLTSDFDTLVQFASVLDINTNPEFARLYLRASLVNLLRGGFKNISGINNSEELLSRVSGEIYGKNIGRTTLSRIDKDLFDTPRALIIKLSRFLKTYVEINVKEADFKEAKLITRTYLELMEGMEDSKSFEKEIAAFRQIMEAFSDRAEVLAAHTAFLRFTGSFDKAEKLLTNNLSQLEKSGGTEKNQEQILKIIDLQDELYLERIYSYLRRMYALSSEEPLCSPNVQDNLSGIVETYYKRKALLEDKGIDIKMDMKVFFQIIYALVNLASGDPAQDQRNYAEALRAVEEEYAEELFRMIGGQEMPDNFVSGLVDLYIYASILNRDSLTEIEKSGKPALEYCVDKLFGQAGKEKVRKTLYADKNDIIEGEMDFIRVIHSIRKYYYDKENQTALLGIMEVLGRYSRHQIKTVADKDIVKKIFSDNEVLIAYFLAEASRIGALDGLFKNEKSFIRYFSDLIFGEGEGYKNARKVLGGKKEMLFLEKTFLTIAHMRHSEYYEANDFDGMRQVQEHYRKLISHQKKTLKDEYTLTEIMAGDDISFYCYSVLLDINLLAEMVDSGLDLMRFVGGKLFEGKDKKEVFRLMVQGSEKEKNNPDDPYYAFIEMYDDMTAKAFQAGEESLALEFIDLYSTFVSHHIGVLSGGVEGIYRGIKRDLIFIRSQIEGMKDKLTDQKEFMDKALNLWKISAEKRNEEMTRKRQQEEKIRQFTESKRKQELEREAAEKAGKKREEELKKIEEDKSGINKKVTEAESEILRAGRYISENRISPARGCLTRAGDIYDEIDSDIKRFGSYLNKITEDLEPGVKKDLENFTENLSDLKKKIKTTFNNFVSVEKKYSGLLEKAKRKNENRISEYREEMAKELEKRSDIDQYFEYMIEKAAEGVIFVSEQKLVDAREILEQILSGKKKVEEYITLLKKREDLIRDELYAIYGEMFGNFRDLSLETEEGEYLYQQRVRMDVIADEWEEVYAGKINELEEKTDQTSKITLVMLDTKIREEELSETAGLKSKWGQIINNINRIKDIIRQVYDLIREEKLQAADRLFNELEKEKMPRFLKPMEDYISLLDLKISEKGRIDLVPVKKKAVDYREQEVKACVETLRNKLREAEKAFEIKLVELREKEAELYDKTAACLLAVENPAKEAVSHAKGIILDQARVVLEKAGKEFPAAEKHIERLRAMAEKAEGDHKEELLNTVFSLEKMKQKAENLREDLNARIKKEEKNIRIDEKKKKAILKSLEKTASLITEASASIGAGAVEEAGQKLDQAQRRIAQIRVYTGKESQRITRILNPRKKQLMRHLSEVKKKERDLSEKVQEQKKAFEKIRKSAEKDQQLIKDVQETHSGVLEKFNNARSLTRDGEFDRAAEVLDEAYEDSHKVAAGIDNLERKNKTERKAWIKEHIDTLKTLFSHEREKIAQARSMLTEEKKNFNEEQKEYEKHETRLKKRITSAESVLARLKTGDNTGAWKWLEETADSLKAALLYQKGINERVNNAYTDKNNPRFLRISEKAESIRQLSLKVNTIEHKVRELCKTVETREEDDKKEKEKAEKFLSDANSLSVKIEKTLDNEDATSAEIYMAQMKEKVKAVDEYLSGLTRSINDAGGIRKLNLSLSKLETEKEVKKIRKKMEGFRDDVFLLETNSFHKGVKDLSVFSRENRSKGAEADSIVPGTDPLELYKRIDHIAFFKKVFEKERGKFQGEEREGVDKELLLDAYITAAVALLDLGEANQEYIKALKQALRDERCKREKKAVIYAALFRHNVEPMDNYNKLISLAREYSRDKKVQIILRGLFLEMGVSVEEQLGFFDNILKLSDEEYEQAGFNVYDDMWISAVQLFSGVDEQENLGYFLSLLDEVEAMRLKKQVDPEFRSFVYYSLIKYSLLKKYEPVKNKVLVKNEILEAENKVEQAGLEIPTNVNSRYTLIVPVDIFKSGDLEKYEVEYADRVDIKTIGAQSGAKFVNRIMTFAGTPGGKGGIDREKIVALLPSDVPEEKLQRLIDNKIRFVRIGEQSIYDAKMIDDINRERFHRNTFAIMILSRLLDGDKLDEPYMRRILEIYQFYVKSHFNLDGVTPEDFARAVTEGDLAIIIKGFLMLRPMEKYDMPEYDIVQEALKSA